MTAREQRLGLGFAAILLIGGGFVGLKQLRMWKQRVDVRAMTLESRRTEAEELLSEKDFWQERSAWLQEKQPLFTKHSEADLALLDLVRESAAKYDVKLGQTQPLQPSERVGLTSASMHVEAQGDFKAVMKWLHSIQEPTAFISVPKLALTPNEQDTSQVMVNMDLQKWFRLPPS